MSVFNYNYYKQVLTGPALRIGLFATLLLGGCAAVVPDQERSSSHIQMPENTEEDAADSSIPDVVDTPPLVAPPQPEQEPELWTLTAQDLPLRDVLFRLGRDAGINVDVDPQISGTVTINAINQSIPQILERIARQVDIRWYYDEAGNLVVEQDTPYWRTYKVDYVNVSRTAITESSISTTITSGGGDGGNNSTSTISQSFNNNFWDTLNSNLAGLLGETAGEGSVAGSIISNPESGVVSVRATAADQELIAEFLNQVTTRSLYQVLIEATIVEVNLSDDYQSGVDWDLIDRNNGDFSFSQDASNLTSPATNVFTIDRVDSPDAIRAVISLLSRFGELQVLSSPKIMALNNQAAMLRVVDNKVYFTVEVEPAVVSSTGPSTNPVFNTIPNTVPVGFVMTITPQVGENDQVTLNVRPTISRISGFVNDPNPELQDEDIPNPIPEIQVREFESILKLYDGQVAVLGGLMQDSITSDVDGLPGLSRLPWVRNVFSYRREVTTKSELIIFIRPVIVRQPSLSGDLRDYREYLPEGGLESNATVRPSQLPTGR